MGGRLVLDGSRAAVELHMVSRAPDFYGSGRPGLNLRADRANNIIRGEPFACRALHIQVHLNLALFAS